MIQYLLTVAILLQIALFSILALVIDFNAIPIYERAAILITFVTSQGILGYLLAKSA